MLKKMKNNKKGFTLVELIVVLVILAILAALLIPALTGYIDKAKNKSIVAETRQAVMAAQTLVDEAYANVQSADKIQFGTGSTDGVTYIGYDKVKELAETAETPSDGEIASGKVTKLVYSHAGRTCTYYADKTKNTATNGTWEGNYYVQ